MAGFTTVTVSGQRLNPATGAARSGTVTFTLAHALSNGGVTSATTFTATLDSGGSFSALIPATNDPGTTPANQVYLMAESLDGGTAVASYALPVTIGNAATGIVLATPANEPATKVTVTGSKSSNAALASLITGLASLGLVTDSTT